ncbi:MAG: hypothetical protein HY342_08245 [Candidatus Lambdaproteobacteria bacterium]|nr:hypothetical protein [Candidatus Lambdaproteobacteria bacterium]
MNKPLKNTKRILPPRPPRGSNQGKRITREQIAEAILQFREQGGLIKKLPSQGDDRRNVVGHRWDSMYESVIER